MRHPKVIRKVGKIFLSTGYIFGVAMACSTAHAQQTRTWNGGGGSGNWMGAPNWGGTAPVAGDSLVFAGDVRLSSTNNFSGGTSFGSITFASGAGAFTLTGNGLFLNGDITNNSSELQTLTTFSGNGISLNGGNRTFRAATGDLLFTTTVSTGSNFLITEAAAGRTVTINGPIQIGSQGGSGGLQVTGAGTTVLGGTNTYTGATTLTNGTLSISSADNLQSTSSVVFSNTSQGTLYASETLSLNKGVTQTGTGSYAVAAGKTLTLTGTVSGAGDLNVNGPGTVVLAAANSYLGATRLTSGTLSISSANNIQSSSSVVFAAGGQSTLHASETLSLGKGVTQTGTGSYAVAAGKTLTLTGTVSGAGDLNVNGPGTLVLAAANNYTGATRLTSGTLSISSANNIQNSTSIVFAAGSQGTLYASETLSLNKGVTQTGTGNYVVAADKTLSLTGAISGAGDLNANGPGTLVLGAVNSYTGATWLTSGTLSIGSADNLQNTSSVIFANTSQGNLYASETLNLSKNITQSGAGRYGVAAGKTLTLSGTISGGSNLNVNGPGTVVLAAANNYTGVTRLLSGTLSISSANNIQSSSSVVFVGSGTQSTLHASETLSLDRGITQTGTGNYAVAAGKTLALTGTISGAGDLNVNGPGTLVLAAANDYTGATRLTSGTLSISSASNIQSSSSVAFAAGAQSTLHASETLSLNKGITQTGTGSYAAAAGKTLTLTGTVSGAGDLNVNGPGTVVLGAVNSYTGATRLSGGTLSISSASNIQSSSSVVFAAGAQSTLHASETLSLGKGVTQTGTGIYAAAAGKTLTLTGTVSGAGDLNVNGVGEVILTASNNFTGATRLTSGTLSIGSASNIQSSSSIVFSSGSQATLNATQSISLSQNITQSGTGNYVIGSGNTLTLGGAISGAGDLHFDGGGTLVLTNTNTFGGATRLASGTLSIQSAANLQSTSSIVFGSGNQATLYVTQTASLNRNITQTGVGNYLVDAGNSLTLGGSISGAGDFVMRGGGDVSLTGINNFTGSTTITSGTLSIDSGANLQSTSSLIFASGSNSTLHVTGSNVNLARNITHTGVGNYEVTVGKTFTLSGTVSGSGDLNLKGNGTMALTGTNTFTGATVINTGTLAINSAANLQSTSSISFMSGTTATLHATVDGINLNKNIFQVARGNYVVDAGNTLTISGTISGIGQLQKYGAGLMVLDAANTYSGRTVVNSGTLRLGAGGSIINANMDIVGGIFDLNGKNINVTDTLTLGLNASSGTILSSSGTSSFSVANSIQVRSGTIGVNLTGNAGLSKTQAGTVVLTGSNSYLGATSITSGTLVVDGSINSDVTVSNTGVLGGSGKINGSVTVQSGAALRPGNSPGILTVESFSLELGGTLGVEISGSLPGFGGYDSLVVNGPVEIEGNLQVSLSIVPTYGSIFFIIQNNGDHEVLGTFNGLAQDDVFQVGEQQFRITYNANRFNGTSYGGYDVALVAIPEPGTWSLLGLGAAYLVLRRRGRKA